MNVHLKTRTKEEMEEMRKKGHASREAKKLAGESLRQEYADKIYHKDLASMYGLRLPVSYLPNTDVKYLKRAIKKLGVDPKEYLSACGAMTFQGLAAMNENMTAHEEVGLLLEYYHENV